MPVIEKAGGLKHLGNGSAALAHPNATAPLALMSIDAAISFIAPFDSSVTSSFGETSSLTRPGVK